MLLLFYHLVKTDVWKIRPKCKLLQEFSTIFNIDIMKDFSHYDKLRFVLYIIWCPCRNVLIVQISFPDNNKA